ncbi:MAG: hypothetical protein RIB46_01835 [Pseudomonadales bacterium]
MLLAAADGSEVHALPTSIEAHRQFAAAEAGLGKPSDLARRDANLHCAAIDRNCLNFVRQHPDVLLSTVPDDAGFWLAHRSALAADPMPIEHLQADDLSVYGAFIAAATGWLRRELATTGLTDLDALHVQVLAHRRRLARSNLILDKITFASTTGVLLFGVNAHMALRQGPGTDAAELRLDEMLAPLTGDELSVRSARDGERVYAAGNLEGAGDSEAAAVDPPWRAHAEALQRLDAMLTVLRALRETYDGRRKPGPPPAAPPEGWQWRWIQSSGSLCLEPASVEAGSGFGDATAVCVEYLAAPVTQAADSEGTTGPILSRASPTAPADCDGVVPDGIEGAWREDPEWTQRAHLQAAPETLTSSLAWGSGASFTITADSVTFELPGIGSIERTYVLVGGSDRRFLLELTDDQGATELMSLTLVPCGLVIDREPDCSSEYCRNARDEALRMISERSGLSLDTLRDQVETGRRERRPPPRIYYRPTKS